MSDGNSTNNSLLGQVFGRLTVISSRKVSGRIYLSCRCICGIIKEIRGRHVMTGATKSCGCWVRDTPSTKTHGRSNDPVYFVWASMIQRCSNKNNKAFRNYGGRGITVCDRWMTFYNFYSDMGPRPPGGTVERINNDKGYSPENCRWATQKEQMQNTRINHYLTCGNRTQTLCAWAAELGVTPGALCSRLSRGWSVEDAVTILPKKVKKAIDSNI